ncbi:fimbrial protein [Salmonella enterica subsp. arizonae]|uniref:Fimbrial protein n=1 Tax=Salmonella enterica subsp. arizonae TaxID=59203 RepID=A0A5Y2QNQ3_SALER|nr:fimbrial protein [Salmonella enterica subsp. arizonae]ECI9859242.1 fimbrial protein [Salmonella enterica subsp. arizonae]
MKRILATVPLISLCLPLVSKADPTPNNVDVDFIATVTATTCTITIVKDGGVDISNDGNSQYSLSIPDVGLDKIIAADETAQANFKLVASDCSSGLGTINMKIQGDTVSGALIKNQSSTAPVAANIGMGLKLRNAADSAFITPNNTATYSWTSDNISNGLPMTVALRETATNQGSTDNFTAKATFNFTYQ